MPVLFSQQGPMQPIDEQAPASSSNDPAPAPAPSTEERLRRYYAKHNPEKLRLVPTVLRQFDGREEELFAMLGEKYGPEPTADEAIDVPADAPVEDGGAESVARYRRRLTRLLVRYDAAQLPHVEALLEMHNGREEVMMLFLASRYGPEPPADGDVQPASGGVQPDGDAPGSSE
jgi:hypothetical protein